MHFYAKNSFRGLQTYHFKAATQGISVGKIPPGSLNKHRSQRGQIKHKEHANKTGV